ncbi:FAD-containing monooxygenase EthA [Metarhizium brunneum]|uniref:FAD-containing monooxygenase EthA n=1 Tax=Metarhizium brunneum TaxID=500148 RepID=A0A7D5Z2W0_9HYPO
MASAPDFDVVIVGAGISGINTAYRIQSNFPRYRYCILEAREAIGGTWDLFKYPGIRSDSDLFTFGFQWYPWNRNNPIATGESILEYLAEASSKHGIDKNIRFKHKLQHASWSTEYQEWTLSVTRGTKATSISSRFVVFGTGYYDYSTPLQAHIPGLDTFAGQVVHPQFWPSTLDYTDKKVVVIGSGATAVTLVPKLAEKAKLATMLQRSPTYIVALPNRSARSLVDYVLPRAVALRLKRLRWIVTSRLLFLFCRAFPQSARWLFRRGTLRLLPPTTSFDPHFNPSYDPWTQRLCVCPDGDFYKALHTGRADVVTGTIRTVTPAGIQLEAGGFLDADVIVTATGLRIQLGGGATVDVDGRPVAPADKFMWRGAMLQDVPNAFFVMGYTNASWTLGADATATLAVRLLRTLGRKGGTSVVPRVRNPEAIELAPLMNLNSTYVKAAAGAMPKAATGGAFAPRGNYLADEFRAKYGSLDGLEWVRRGEGNGKA